MTQVGSDKIADLQSHVLDKFLFLSDQVLLVMPNGQRIHGGL